MALSLTDTISFHFHLRFRHLSHYQLVFFSARFAAGLRTTLLPCPPVAAVPRARLLTALSSRLRIGAWSSPPDGTARQPPSWPWSNCAALIGIRSTPMSAV